MNPALLAEIADLVAQLGPLAIDLITKIESIGTLGSDEKANIANAIASANATNQDTINKVGAWMAANGFKAQVTFVKAQ